MSVEDIRYPDDDASDKFKVVISEAAESRSLS